MREILFYIFITLFATLSTSLAQGQNQNKAEVLVQDTTQKFPQLSFVSQVYDFGEIRKGEKITTSFYFKNTGTKPLLILQVQTSCGCTATRWTPGEIAPDQTGEITVTYDSGIKDHTGLQNKVILVISNAVNKEEKLYLKGTVQSNENK